MFVAINPILFIRSFHGSYIIALSPRGSTEPLAIAFPLTASVTILALSPPSLNLEPGGREKGGISGYPTQCTNLKCCIGIDEPTQQATSSKTR